MPRYQLSNGNVVLADQSFIDAHYPGALLLQDDSVPAPPAVSYDISKRAFIKRLTPDYWLDLEDAAASIRDLRKLVLLFNNSSYISLKDPDVVAGVSAAINPLMPVQLQKTQEEVDAILETPCQAGEEP